MTGHLTRKSDVYSFGVVLFELLSGRRAVDTMLREEEWNLANWAKRCVKERRLNQVVSSHIKTQISSKCLKEFVQIARRCLKSSRKKRPTMADVVVALQQSLALQEHFNSAAQAAGSTGFTHKMQNLLFGSRHNSGDPETPSSTHDGLSEYSLRVFSYRDMKLATRNFSSRMLLGHGHYGEVFRGWLHKKTYCPSMSDSGLPVAIKRLYTHKFKPDMVKEEDFDAQRSEFRREVELLAKIGHRNIVKLLGYVDKENELLIITEYVTNGTLREHLDGVHGSYLDFVQRLEICIDIAHGLTYLHLYAGKQIIHRDIKSSNILLTERLKAIVADFGFATLGETDKTHVVTKVRGTVGYLDPEYMRTYELTSKSDVYSFGILLIEILTGRSPIEYKRPPEEKVTVTWASGKYKEGDITDLVDPQMKESLETEIFVNMLKLAFQCVAPTRADRPDINVVAEKLWAIRIDSLRNGRK
ncbi:hypothetical protein L1987_27769 [Smallanthus sonchifolius]|uniref:Uncharacterized protein n=1 Tax=Smallanthus sonchifolius TaxID=185202 RepID=A0ACB9ID58_9ASTR|nr:hypothetical protein L1987_27769 [Smallanthus sonchifolius]